MKHIPHTTFLYADSCLSLLCSKSEVISKVLEWISSDDLPLDLKASAALIVANIARNGMFACISHLILSAHY